MSIALTLALFLSLSAPSISKADDGPFPDGDLKDLSKDIHSMRKRIDAQTEKLVATFPSYKDAYEEFHKQAAIAVDDFEKWTKKDDPELKEALSKLQAIKDLNMKGHEEAKAQMLSVQRASIDKISQRLANEYGTKINNLYTLNGTFLPGNSYEGVRNNKTYEYDGSDFYANKLSKPGPLAKCKDQGCALMLREDIQKFIQDTDGLRRIIKFSKESAITSEKPKKAERKSQECKLTAQVSSYSIALPLGTFTPQQNLENPSVSQRNSVDHPATQTGQNTQDKPAGTAGSGGP